MSGLLIKGGHVIDPRNHTNDIRDIYIDAGCIQKLPADKSALSTFDATGMIVVPGLIDLHVHFREPGFEYKEDILTGSKAAARGGYTTVCCMPNTSPVADNKEVIELIHRRGKEAGMVNLLAVGALSKGQEGRELADYEGMQQAEGGIIALSEDGKTLMDGELMLQAAKCAKKLGLFISDHAEDEAEIVKRDIAIAKETGCHIHLQHISAKESVDLIREAKRSGLPITAETTPHHFALTKDALKIFGTNAKMNPPLREESDRQAIIAALQDGTIDAIATDHAPHSAEEKALPMEQAPFGVVGLETAFAISYSILVLGGYISLPELIRLTSLAPANILKTNRGGLAIGDIADIAVFDINAPYTIDKNEFVSKGKNTPFDGMTVHGRTKLTVRGGNIIFVNRERV